MAVLPVFFGAFGGAVPARLAFGAELQRLDAVLLGDCAVCTSTKVGWCCLFIMSMAVLEWQFLFGSRYLCATSSCNVKFGTYFLLYEAFLKIWTYSRGSVGCHIGSRSTSGDGACWAIQGEYALLLTLQLLSRPVAFLGTDDQLYSCHFLPARFALEIAIDVVYHLS